MQANDKTQTINTLPAGTNLLGKVGIDQTTPGTTNAVQVTNTALIGAGNPTVDSYTSEDFTGAADTANQSIISAPGENKQIWVYGIQFTIGTGDGSVSFQDEDDAKITEIMTLKQDTGMVVTPTGNFSMPLWKVPTNKAFEVDTVTCDIKGSIQYGIVSV